MKEMFISNTPQEFYEIAVWLIMVAAILFGYKYFLEILEYVLLKLYEFFIQHKF